MTDTALSTLPRDAKGPLAPPPAMEGAIGRVADAIAAWPSVTATTHWSLDHTAVDGVDFYVGEEELATFTSTGRSTSPPARHSGR